MAVKVFITIDTEEDAWGDYKSTQGTVENIKQLPLLQELFNRYGAIPTYLINYPVATNPSSIKILSSFLENNMCEIGTHCHPWNTPPFVEDLNENNSMMCNLPLELVSEKMKNLHEVIEKNFNIKPVSFRAGRWGFNETVAKCLNELDYKIDTSISPFVDWRPYCGKNFVHGSTQPYYFTEEDIFKSDSNGSLMEVPPTIGFYQKNFQLCDLVKKTLSKPPFSKLRLLGIFDRLRLLNFHWLSPELSSGEEMVRLAKRFVNSGHQHLNMSFHSTSLLPGKSPFVKTEDDLKIFLNKIEIFLKYAAENDFDFLPLAEAINQLNVKR